MNKFRTVVSVIIMILASIVGLYVGVALHEGGGTERSGLICAHCRNCCVIYAPDNPDQ